MTRQIPLEDFFRNSERTGYQLSPDGSYISYMAPYKDRLNVFVRRVDETDEHAIRITNETERSVAGYMWADNQRLLYMKDTAGDENYQLYGVHRDGSDDRAYTAFDGVRTSLIDDLEEQPGVVMIGMNKRNPEVFDPYRLNIETGELTLLAENPGNIQGWMTDHDGRLRAATAIVDGVNTQILYRDTEDEPFKPVLTTNFRDVVSFMEFTPDNKEVYAATNLHRDKTILVRMNPATCEELEVLYENERYDIASISYSRKRKKLLSVYCTGHKEPVRHYFDAEEEQLRQRIKAHFPNQRYGIADTDKAEANYLIYVGGDRTRGSYWHYNALTDEAKKIADLAPWIKSDEMNAMHPVCYTTRDGLQIEAYLTLPDGLTPDTAKQLPIVVNPHGGPWARDCWGYSSEVQFLSNRGYAVFQMNFRGSTGYGRHFLEASYKQWGLKMQDDITDGVKWLIEQGIANPNRIAIYGGSYGGYATLAGLTFTPDLYACGIDYVGVSNLFTFMQTIPPYWRPMLEMMYEQVGHPEHDADQLAATSPALHADKIKVPLFVAQGANDPRVNKAESDQMVEALRQRGVVVEYMVKDNEGHGFHNQENRFDFYRAMERFLKAHL
ncbi:prolyl oligopeptidase family serine peptidase [Prevotellamassilia timonensis]|uniref:prolyl oligopeptidase family serine peptidase n=1 Tax=Prevotellamassilia timonensis TaxID=1852370 RepID=UPI003FD739F1